MHSPEPPRPSFASLVGAMINQRWLDLPMSRAHFHGPKDDRVIEVRLYMCLYVWLLSFTFRTLNTLGRISEGDSFCSFLFYFPKRQSSSEKGSTLELNNHAPKGSKRFCCFFFFVFCFFFFSFRVAPFQKRAKIFYRVVSLWFFYDSEFHFHKFDKIGIPYLS